MRHSYRCDACGCYLDPGEGNQCDECRTQSRIRIKKMDKYNEMIAESKGGQYEMKLREAI